MSVTCHTCPVRKECEDLPRGLMECQDNAGRFESAPRDRFTAGFVAQLRAASPLMAASVDALEPRPCPWEPCGFALCAEFGPRDCERRGE